MKFKARENIDVLQQSMRLLGRIDDQIYRREVEALMMGSVGTHVRHNLDHYDRFFVGFDTGMVDYDARLRQRVLEVDRQAALTALERACGCLTRIVESPNPQYLTIRWSVEQGARHAASSVVRELDYLLSHTVHHHAIIAMLCRLQNVTVDPEFGVAPSTLRHRQTSNILRSGQA